ncbi:Rieske (2Fe-2S) protein [Streptomyces sp. E11-3]|uniref:Rieske (2Fe-2S) protein n=1 Tax=Streptomyces sp. E11-3 TaxID=3110112 RepID=UPI00397E9BD0
MTGTARRSILAAGAAALAGGAVAGCTEYGGEGGSPDDGAGSPNDDGGSADATTAPATGQPPGDALAQTSDIPVGGGKVFADRKVVVTQPQQGDFKAFSAVCTHQGCTVRDVADGTINCPCHGSRYRVDDASVAEGPAPRPLPPQRITVTEGTIRLA